MRCRQELIHLVRLSILHDVEDRLSVGLRRTRDVSGRGRQRFHGSVREGCNFAPVHEAEAAVRVVEGGLLPLQVVKFRSHKVVQSAAYPLGMVLAELRRELGVRVGKDV